MLKIKSANSSDADRRSTGLQLLYADNVWHCRMGPPHCCCAPCSNRSISPAGHARISEPAGCSSGFAAVGPRWDRRTDARQMHGLVTTLTTAVTVKVPKTQISSEFETKAKCSKPPEVPTYCLPHECHQPTVTKCQLLQMDPCDGIML